MEAPIVQEPGCPTCGSTAGSGLWRDGVCLRCAGERLLGAVDPGGVAMIEGGFPQQIGPYEILEEIGRGGMGRVYAARQTGLGRVVALKVMEGAGRGTDFELRFLRESQTAAGLRHPNLVTIHDSGRADGFLYFSMDYVEGGDLAKRLRGRAFAPWEAASLLRKIALALAHAHERGVIHRDIKPSNILLDGEEPKLADFGLAAPLEPGGDLTMVTGVIGTPHYLAPEALLNGSGALSVASDVYAAGVVLFELLTGRTPFAGAAPGALVALADRSEPPSPRLLAPAVPKDLETICLKCLERDPLRRYPDATSLAEDLRRFLDGEPIIARPLSIPGRFFRWCRRRPALATVWVLVFALAVGSTVAVVTVSQALRRTRVAEAESRERLRAARIAEARAVRHLDTPGRRSQALAALAEAARIRPGADVRDEYIAALMIPDITPLQSWPLGPGGPAIFTYDPAASWAAVEELDQSYTRTAARLHRWGDTNVAVRLGGPKTNAIGELRFSRDGTMLINRFLDDTLCVWKTGEGEPFLVLRGHPNPGGNYTTAFFNDDYDFLPDSSGFVLGVPGGGLARHRLPDGGETGRVGSKVVFTRVRVSPDGRWIAAIRSADAETKEVSLFRLPAFEAAGRVVLPAGPNSMAWSADSRLLAVSLANNTVEVHDVALNRIVAQLNAPVRSPGDLAFVSRDSLLALRGNPTVLHFESPVHGASEIELPNFGLSVVNGSPDGETAVTTSVDGISTRWKIESPVGSKTLAPPAPGGREQSFSSAGLDFSPDGGRVLSAHGRYLVLRDTHSGRLLGEFDDHDEHGIESSTVAFEKDGSAVFHCSNFTGLTRIELRDGPDGTVTFLPGYVLDPTPGFQITDRSRDRKRFVLTSPSEGIVRVIDLAGTNVTTVSRWSVPGAYSAMFDPAAERVIVNCDGSGGDSVKIAVYRIGDGSVLATLVGHAFGEAAWSENGKIAMTSNGQGESVLWDAATWKPKARLTGVLGGNISTFQIAPDGSYAVIARDGFIHLVSTAGGQLLAKIEPPHSPGMASGIRFTPDGKRFGVLWSDSRLDMIEPEAIRKELEPLGLAWPGSR